MADFRGVLQADAYAGFNALFEDGGIQEAACWAHARRKLYDLHESRPSALTTEALRRLSELYAIEADIAASHLTNDTRIQELQDRASRSIYSSDALFIRKDHLSTPK